MGKKLIIIGNGHDLHAGLESSFSAFFEKCEIPKIERWLNAFTEESLNGVNFVSLLLYNAYFKSLVQGFDPWEHFYFEINYQKEYSKQFELEKKPVDWMDVESFINAVLKSNGTTKLRDCFKRCFGGHQDHEDKGICGRDYLPLFMSQARVVRNYYSLNNFYDFFFEELKLFENNFASYLKKDFEAKTVDYQDKSTHIFSKILVGKENNDGIVLNFNYTNSFGYLFGLEEINVHGYYENNIIIGIDDRNALDTNMIQFTKTFRKLMDPDKSVVLKGKVDEIVIYGHSLGEQDYSYFQSIFDFANIYSSETKVRFIYSDDFVKEDPSNPGYTKKMHGIKMAQKLFKLMKEYGKTLTNKDNGQNLIHKMILEGRLSVELNNFEPASSPFKTQ